MENGVENSLHQKCRRKRKKWSWVSWRSFPLSSMMMFVWQLLLCRYLHEICLPAVVHHNFNSGNILLDDELNPQLSDCGFADLSSPASVSQVYIHTRICKYKDASECYDGVYVCIVVISGWVCRYHSHHHKCWHQLGIVPQSMPCLVFTPWRVMFIDLVLWCWSFWQDASHWTGLNSPLWCSSLKCSH